jgi:hypothetical protein
MARDRLGIALPEHAPLEQQKSAVSSAFVRASKKDLDALNGRPLGEWNFTTIYIDGAWFAEHMAVVTMGIATDGRKHRPARGRDTRAQDEAMEWCRDGLSLDGLQRSRVAVS